MDEATYRKRVSAELNERYQTAVDLIEQTEYSEATELLQQITEMEPGFAPAHNKLGVIEARRKNHDRAREHFDAAVLADSGFAPALTNLGNLALSRGEYDVAQALYRRALSADPGYGLAHNNLAVVLRRQGRYGEAIGHIRKARRRRSYYPGTDNLSEASGRRGCLVTVGVILLGLLVVTVLLLR